METVSVMSLYSTLDQTLVLLALWTIANAILAWKASLSQPLLLYVSPMSYLAASR